MPVQPRLRGNPMDTASLVLGLFAGLTATVVIWLFGRTSLLRQRAEAERDLATLRERAAMLEAQAAELRAAREGVEQRLADQQREVRLLNQA